MSGGKNKIGCTLILRRIYDAPVARLWRAWTDPAELARWYVAGDDHIVHFCEADVRVGGTYRIGFAPPGKTPYIETGRYIEIVPNKRLVFEEQVSFEGKRLGGTMNEIEFRDLGGRTEIVLSSSGEEAWRSGEGWTPCLESLARYLGE
jgi:uncharacterized protein YndB with AHSA1/START domain